MSEEIFIVGNDEDGGFLRKFDDEEAFNEWLSLITRGDETDGIDFSELREHSANARFTVDHYSDDYRTFAVIVGEAKEIGKKDIVTEVALE